MDTRFLLVVLALLLAGCAIRVPAPERSSVVVKLTLPNKPPTTLPNTQTTDQKIVYSFNRDLDWYATGGHQEASRRFVNPVVVQCHGATDPFTKKWTAYADYDRGGKMVVEELAKALAKRFPDRDIVLFTCNRGAHQINVPRVWYFRSVVWTMPDIDSVALENSKTDAELMFYRIMTDRENIRGFGYAGSIWEAVTQHGSWR